MVQDLTEPIPRFGIKHVLLLTSLTACLLAFFRLVGPRIAFCCFCVIYGLAPTLAILGFACMRNYPLSIRLATAAGSMVAVTAAMLCLAQFTYGPNAVPWVMIGALVEWPGQFLVGATLHLIRDAEQRSRAGPEE
jgi:hypothetical protein